ncbi:MAG: hypothetical protein JW697_07080 [Kosmotogaceae bacterium]|nr:hypothetical protein [Kosmotogaceae bacterium]
MEKTELDYIEAAKNITSDESRIRILYRSIRSEECSKVEKIELKCQSMCNARGRFIVGEAAGKCREEEASEKKRMKESRPFQAAIGELLNADENILHSEVDKAIKELRKSAPGL